jgi:uncharacterized membrane protein YeaQ/YmgE (transglycosylase-associated protein family)
VHLGEVTRPTASPSRFENSPVRKATLHMSISAIIGWCVFGLIIGCLARFLMPGRQHMGLLLTMILGIAVSFVGGFIASLFSGGGGLSNPAGWIMSTIGALVVLFVYSKIAGPKA